MLAMASLSACVATGGGSAVDCDASDVAVALEISATSMTPDDPAACRGQRVTLELVSSVDGYLHVHGYDEALPVIDVRAGESSEVSFDASRSGQFPIELHTDEEMEEASLGVLTVHEP